MSVPVSVFWSIKWDNHRPLCGALRSLSNSGKHVTGQYLRQGKTDKSSQVTLNRMSSRTVESLHLLEKGYAAKSRTGEAGGRPSPMLLPRHPTAQSTRAVLCFEQDGFFPPCLFLFLARASAICELHCRGQVFDNLNKTSGSLN